MDTVEDRVARGADWLDAVYPEWYRRIDVGALDIRNGCRCVLGQMVEGGYMVIVDLAPHHGWIEDYGFAGDDYAALDEAWIAEIKRRWERGL